MSFFLEVVLYKCQITITMCTIIRFYCHLLANVNCEYVYSYVYCIQVRFCDACQVNRVEFSRFG